jgi:phosphohistidine phosphatase
MGDYMEREGLEFGLILCSSSRRTRETIGRALPASEARVEVLEELYLATPDEMLELVRQTSPGIRDVLLVGHNPGIHDLAAGLAGEGPSSRIARLHEKFPTGALATLSFDSGRWERVLPGKGRLERFMRPKDLPEADDLRL